MTQPVNWEKTNPMVLGVRLGQSLVLCRSSVRESGGNAYITHTYTHTRGFVGTRGMKAFYSCVPEMTSIACV